MFTAIVRARPEPIALAATLGPLVRGVVQGLVGSAVLVAEGDHPDLADIADSAGCRSVIGTDWPSGFARAVAGTSGSAVLVIDTGVILSVDFWPMIADQMPMLRDRPAVTIPPQKSAPWHAIRRWMQQAAGRITPDSALLLPGSRARAIAQAQQDPWNVAFGSDLVRLGSQSVRIPPR